MKIIIFFIPFFVFSSEIPNFKDLSQCEGCVFLLTTPRSGSNLVSGSLSAITRRPISWIRWGSTVFSQFSHRREHVSYNRLELPLISDKPLLYRTHYELEELKQIPMAQNKLIFLTRNPKEVLFRAHLLAFPKQKEPDFLFVKEFLNKYLEPFRIYELWDQENRMLIYYEDFVIDGDAILLDILHFMQVEPTYFEDFIANKQEYQALLLESYRKQHERNNGGFSVREKPESIFYSKGVRFELLARIDEYIQEREPHLWEQYLKRFESKK